jgi:hypothetical protein
MPIVIVQNATAPCNSGVIAPPPLSEEKRRSIETVCVKASNKKLGSQTLIIIVAPAAGPIKVFTVVIYTALW